MAAIKLVREKGIPKVKIEVGYNQPATYKSWLKSPDGTKLSLGNDNEIDLATVPGIKSVHDLIDRTFIWDVRVISATGGANEKYYVAVSFTQDGVPVCDSIVSQGKFEGNAAWCFDSALFY